MVKVWGEQPSQPPFLVSGLQPLQAAWPLPLALDAARRSDRGTGFLAAGAAAGFSASSPSFFTPRYSSV